MITTHPTANAFLQACQPMLEEKEAENNLILGLAITINRDIKYYSNLPPLFITIHDQAECVGACLQTPPHNLIIYATKKHLDRSIRELCDYLVDHQIKLPGMIGSKDTVLKFVERWTSMNPFSSGDQINQMVYKLEKVNPIPIADGKLRQATDLDLELIADWMGKFHVEALQSISAKEATELAVKKIREGALYLWETDQPVSMVGWTRPTRNGVTIAYVYTPLQYRKRGYATSSVAKLSELLLAQHRFCALFTDLSNPTSNSIYQKIGYQALDHVLQCKFLKN